MIEEKIVYDSDRIEALANHAEFYQMDLDPTDERELPNIEGFSNLKNVFIVPKDPNVSGHSGVYLVLTEAEALTLAGEINSTYKVLYANTSSRVKLFLNEKDDPDNSLEFEERVNGFKFYIYKLNDLDYIQKYVG